MIGFDRIECSPSFGLGDRLRRNPQQVHEREVKDLQAKVGELVLELDAREKWEALNGRDEKAF